MIRDGNYESQYMKAFKKCLEEGYNQINTRTGKGVRRLEHIIFQLELEEDLPILHSKKVFQKSAIDEILWIMQRQSNKRVDINSKIWDEWTGADGTIGKAYGFQIAPDVRTDKECYIIPRKGNIDASLDISQVSDVINNHDSLNIKTIRDIIPNLTLSNDTIKSLFSTWYNMFMLASQDVEVTVDKKWLTFLGFIQDVRYIPNWRLANDNLEDFVLSKEYFKSNNYSNTTCVWLPKSEESDYLYLDQYCEPNEEGKYLRKKLNVNQINDVILAIKNDPSSRRMVTTLWKADELDEMNLQPCVYTCVFSVIGDRLNCMVTQRSGDCCVGVPFNTYQYAVLTRIIAKSCGLKAGKLTHCIADFHIYSDQFEEAKLQLARYEVLQSVARGEVIAFEKLKADGVLTDEMTRDYLEDIVKSDPKLILGEEGSDEIIDFYDWELDKNIKLVKYNSLPAIKYEVAV